MFSFNMHFKVCTIILAAAYIVYADEQFLDIFYENEDDLEDLVSRARRSVERDEKEFEKEYFTHIAYCCDESEIRFKAKEYGEIMADIKSECVPETDNITDIKEHAFCFYECIFEIMNVTDENGNIVEDPEQLNQLKIIYKIDHETTLQNIASKCPAWSKEAVMNIQEETECNPQSLYFLYCAFDMRNLYCPVEFRIKDERCDEHRQNLTKIFQ